MKATIYLEGSKVAIDNICRELCYCDFLKARIKHLKGSVYKSVAKFVENRKCEYCGKMMRIDTKRLKKRYCSWGVEKRGCAELARDERHYRKKERR